MNDDSSLDQSVSPTFNLASTLASMSDEAVKMLIADCNKLLKQRERQSQKQVQAQIKKMATKAGISVSFTAKLGRKSS